MLGFVAVDPAARSDLTAQHLAGWAGLAGLAVTPGDWWIDSGSGVALLAPEATIDVSGTSQRAALSIRGVVQAGGRDTPPPGWTAPSDPDGASRLLYDVLARDLAAIDGLRGQFALAAWDGLRERLFIARDHFGQRTVFTTHHHGLLAFSSDFTLLTALRSARVALDHESAFWYLAFGVPPPGRTMARDVGRVRAAHALVWRPGELPRSERYWTPLVADAPRDATPEVVAAIGAALDQSIARSVTGARPGVLLSGGVDSTYLAAGAIVASGVAPPAYTVEFEPECGMNETEWARAVAEWLGLRHCVVQVHAAAALDVLRAVVLPAQEPCAAWATISHHVTLASARDDGCSTLLSGLGADELFGGYDHFRGAYARYLRYARRQQRAGSHDPFGEVVLPGGRDTARVLFPGVSRFFDDASLRAALCAPLSSWEHDSHSRAFYRECRELKPDAQMMELMVAHECQHRIPDILFADFEPVARNLDVEVRYPFLDPDVARLVTGLSVTSRYRTRRGHFSLRLRDLEPNFKHAMLELARGRVPEAIVNRPRKSFTAPFGAWLHHPEFGPAVIAALRASALWDARIVRPEWLDTVLARVAPGPNPWVFQLWALVTLAAWCDFNVATP